MRNRLSQDFIVTIHRHFVERGHVVFDELLANEPGTYARLLASLVSKQVEVYAQSGIASEFSDEQVLEIIGQLDRWDQENRGRGEGAAALPALPEAEGVS